MLFAKTNFLLSNIYEFKTKNKLNFKQFNKLYRHIRVSNVHIYIHLVFKFIMEYTVYMDVCKINKIINNKAIENFLEKLMFMTN